MLLEGGKVGKESPMSILPHDVEPSFRRSSGENQTLPMINMIIYIYIIAYWSKYCNLHGRIFHDQICWCCNSIQIFILFNPRKFLSGRSGRIDLYALWRSKMHPGWVMFGRADWPEKMCSSWYMCKGNSLSKSSLVLDEHYNGSIPKAESLHVDTFCYCHIGKSMELIALELNCFVPQQIIHIYIYIWMKGTPFL